MNLWTLLTAISAVAMTVPAGAATLGRDQLCGDIAALKAGIVRMHPRPFHAVSEAAFDARSAELCAEADTLSDGEMIAGMAGLVAMLGEGHSRLDLPFSQATGLAHDHGGEGQRIERIDMFPLRLSYADGQYVVVLTAPGNRELLGASLIAINDHDIGEAIAAMAPLVNAENDSNRKMRMSTFLLMPQLLEAQGLASDGESVLRFRTPDGETVERNLQAATEPPGADWPLLPTQATVPDDVPSRTLWTETLDGGLVYTRLSAIEDAEGYTIDQLAADVETALAATPSPTLVIDLRGNTGGDNTLIDPIVRLAVRDRRLWQPGRLFVLIDGWTFSAAMNLANALQRWTPALFVGSPTGASPNSYGDARPLALPNSGLSARISTLYWQDAGPQDQRPAIRPDLPAPRTQAGLIGGTDEAMALISGFAAPPAQRTGRFSGTATVGPIVVSLGDVSTLTLPGLGVDAAVFDSLGISSDGTVSGDIMLGPQHAEIGARIAGDHMLGWIRIFGKYFPFALERGGLSG